MCICDMVQFSSTGETPCQLVLQSWTTSICLAMLSLRYRRLGQFMLTLAGFNVPLGAWRTRQADSVWSLIYNRCSGSDWLIAVQTSINLLSSPCRIDKRSIFWMRLTGPDEMSTSSSRRRCLRMVYLSLLHLRILRESPPRVAHLDDLEVRISSPLLHKIGPLGFFLVVQERFLNRVLCTKGSWQADKGPSNGICANQHTAGQ